MMCDFCSGSGGCDPCDGYGTLPDSYPNAGDRADCGMCESTGVCPVCTGTGTTDTDSDTNDSSVGVMT